MLDSCENTEQAYKRLHHSGICVLPNVITEQDIRDCKNMKGYKDAEQCGTSQFRFRDAHFWESTKGRYHQTEFVAEDEELLGSFEASWLPLIDAYLPVKEDGKSHSRSQLQLLISNPQSADQFFHQDNSRKGITVFIPLVDVTLENGPTQLLPGSHHTFSLQLDKDADTTPNSDASKPPSVTDSMSIAERLTDGSVRGCMPAGAAIVYDSRVFHRGLANKGTSISDETRPGLVYRYDYPDAPPPGHGLLSTAAFRVIGRIICGVWPHM